jgi:hypothetical protein
MKRRARQNGEPCTVQVQRSEGSSGSMDVMSEGNAGAANEERGSLFIRLSFFPSEQLVSAISRLVSDFCQIGVRDLDISARFHMAAHELAENITRYSSSSRVSLEVELIEKDGVRTLSVRTRNQASPDRLAEVEKRLKELKATDDPVGFYDRMIEETAPLDGISGLGLARIRAEAGLDFDYVIDGDELTLVVQTSVPMPPALGSSNLGAPAT